eukprot:TRINITY_DN65054_c0_g1_i1.p2 TRINITY_DN65054_c0_g1~~TRINITY_DN65054_c0_g1_i1.p2  ORF type:complete len:208 (+),score=28.20 TRINITY_DN65054_c0_g1_i1:536-1159(+)
MVIPQFIRSEQQIKMKKYRSPVTSKLEQQLGHVEKLLAMYKEENDKFKVPLQEMLNASIELKNSRLDADDPNSIYFHAEKENRTKLIDRLQSAYDLFNSQKSKLVAIFFQQKGKLQKEVVKMLNGMWELAMNAYKGIEGNDIELLGQIRILERRKESIHKDIEAKDVLEADMLKAVNKLDPKYLHYFVDLWLYAPLVIEQLLLFMQF